MVSTDFIKAFEREFRFDFALLSVITAFGSFMALTKGGYEAGLFLLLITFLLLFRSFRLFRKPIELEDDLVEEPVALKNALIKDLWFETGAFVLLAAFTGIGGLIEHKYFLGFIFLFFSLSAALHLRSALKSPSAKEFDEFSIAFIQQISWEIFLVALGILALGINALRNMEIIKGLIFLLASIIFCSRIFAFRKAKGLSQAALPFRASSLVKALIKDFRWELILLLILSIDAVITSLHNVSVLYAIVFTLIGSTLARWIFFMPPAGND